MLARQIYGRSSRSANQTRHSFFALGHLGAVSGETVELHELWEFLSVQPCQCEKEDCVVIG